MSDQTVLQTIETRGEISPSPIPSLRRNAMKEEAPDAGAIEHDSWFDGASPARRDGATAEDKSSAARGRQELEQPTTPRSKDMDTPNLFERLGGSSGINKLVEGIVALHMDNPTIRARFRPYLGTPDKLAITKKHLCAFLEAGSGGAAQYCGRSMPDAHRGMNISEAEYMAALDDILQAMRQNDIDEQTQKDVLAIAYSLKGDIIRV